MAVEVLVRPLKGRQEIDGRIVEDCDTGVDEVCLVSKEYPVPRAVGVVGRSTDSPVCLSANVSQSEEAAIKLAVSKRTGREAKVKTAPTLEDGADE